MPWVFPSCRLEGDALAALKPRMPSAPSLFLTLMAHSAPEVLLLPFSHLLIPTSTVQAGM